jgi:hypothetical protein
MFFITALSGFSPSVLVFLFLLCSFDPQLNCSFGFLQGFFFSLTEGRAARQLRYYSDITLSSSV